MLGQSVIFVTPPAYEEKEFDLYPNERAQLRNAVSELRFLVCLILNVPKEKAFQVLPEARGRGGLYSLELRLIYGWLQTINQAKPSEATKLFYDCCTFISTIHETLRNNV